MRINGQELDTRLNKNGWAWFSLSNTEPGVFRIQLGGQDEAHDWWRKDIEASTAEQALIDAEKFVQSISADDYAASLRPLGGE